MTTPPDDPGSPGPPYPPGVHPDGASGSSGTHPAPIPPPPQDALARILDRRVSPNSAHAEALLRALVDASPLAMWVLDPEGRVVLWNRAAERLTGWTADEALGRIAPIVPPDKIDEFRRLFGQTLDKKPIVGAEVRRRKKDGSPIDLSLSSAAIVAADGNAIAVLVMAGDVTARKEAEAAERKLASERAAREAADAARGALEESEARFRSLVEASAQIVWRTDAEGRFVTPMPDWTAITGQPSSQAEGSGLLETIHAEDRVEVARLWREAIANQRPFVATFRLRMADDAYRWFASRGVPIRNDDSSVREWVGTLSDIHERKSAEAALRESEARFRALAESLRESESRHRRIFETVDVSIWEEDFSEVKAAIDRLKRDGVTDIRRYLAEHPAFVSDAAALMRVKDVNDTTLTIFGARDKAELQQGLHRIFTPDTMTTVAEEIVAIFEGQTRFQSEARVQTLDGRPLQVAFTMVFPAGDPELRSVLVSLIDITDRKRVEAERETLLTAERAARLRTEQLQRVTAALVDAVTIEDVADRVVETVRATTTAKAATLALLSSDGSQFEVIRLMGLPETEIAKWQRFPVEDGYPSTEAVRTGEPVFIRSLEELRSRFPKIVAGAEAYGFAASAVLPLVVAGVRVGTLSLNYTTPQPFDVSKRAYLAAVAQQCAQALERARLFEAERTARADSERARQDADAARAVAEQASRAKSDFLATMSHELRTPLNAIIGYQSLLADGVTGPVSDSQRRQLERIGASAQHLLMLIDEVLTLSRVEAGKESIRIEPVDLAVILDEASSIIEPLARQKHLDFRVIGSTSPITMRTDGGKLRQAILNLLSNAVKFTGRGSVTLRASSDGDDVLFEVSDTGIGIATEHVELIFEPFWQVEGSTTRTASGTGLGLAVTRRLVLALGGTISVQSAVGEGSTFTIRLPRTPTAV